MNLTSIYICCLFEALCFGLNELVCRNYIFRSSDGNIEDMLVVMLLITIF